MVDTLERVGPATIEHAYDEWASYVLEESANFAARREQLEKMIACNKAMKGENDNDDDLPVEGDEEDDDTSDATMMKALATPTPDSTTPSSSSSWGAAFSSMSSWWSAVNIG